MQYVKTTAIIGAVIVGEPNNSKETAVHLYAKDLSEQYIGHWNDTYNKYDGANTYFSYKKCGIICEWESNPSENLSGGCFVKLSNGLFAKLDKDPALGDYTVDTDGDGLCDLEELNTVINIPVFNPYNGLGAESYKTISVWSFNSNPTKPDTDGDGYNDIEDCFPLKIEHKGVVLEALNSQRLLNLENIYKHIDNTENFYVDDINIMETRSYIILMQKSLEYLGYLDMGGNCYGAFGGKTYAALNLYKLNHNLYTSYDVSTNGIDDITFFSILKSALDNGYDFGNVTLTYTIDEVFSKYNYKVTKSKPKELTDVTIVMKKSYSKEMIYIYDLTVPFNKILKYGAKEFHNYSYSCNDQISLSYPIGIDDLKYYNSDQVCRKNIKPIIQYAWLYDKVKTQGKYDIKYHKSWNDLFSEIDSNIPFYGASFPVNFNGKEINAEIFGNILYGYISNAGGFDYNKISSGGSIYSALETGELDDKSDSTAIREGYSMYDTVKRNYEYLHTY